MGTAQSVFREIGSEQAKKGSFLGQGAFGNDVDYFGRNRVRRSCSFFHAGEYFRNRDMKCARNFQQCLQPCRAVTSLKVRKMGCVHAGAERKSFL